MLPRFQDVGIHSQAHTASGFSPIKSRILEDDIQTLFFGLCLDPLGTRHHHGLTLIEAYSQAQGYFAVDGNQKPQAVFEEISAKLIEVKSETGGSALRPEQRTV